MRIEFEDMSVSWLEGEEGIYFSDGLSQCVDATGQGVVETVQHTVSYSANACEIKFTTDRQGDASFPRITEKSLLIGANSGGAAITITD